MSDYTVYNVAFFNSDAAAAVAYKRFPLLYMHGAHLNMVQMVSFMQSPVKSPRKVSKAKANLNSEFLKSPAKVESSQLPVSASLPGAKFELGASAFSGSEDETPMSDSELEPPRKKIFSESGSDVMSTTDVVQPIAKPGPNPIIMRTAEIRN